MSVTLRRTVTLVSIGLACLLGWVLWERGRASPPPHIVLYLVDTLRADALGAYGNSQVHTPSFDKVAHGGTRFDRAYAPASWTRATVGSILTGEYPTVHGAVGRFDRLRPDLPTLAEELHRMGYETAAVVANPNLAPTFGLARGFDEYVELYDPITQVRAIEPQELVATSAQVVDRALAILRRPRSKPLFLFVFAIDPHAPYTPPPPFDRLYDPDYRGAVDGSFQSLFALAILGRQAPEPDRKHLRALYDGEVAYADREFGRLLEELERDPWAGKTVLVVTSDHGEEFLEHDRLDHGHTVYEELIRVPLMFYLPGRPRSIVVEGPVSLTELFPTLLDYAGARERPIRSRSLRPFMEPGPPTKPIAHVFAEVALYDPAWEALVVDHGKLIRNRTSGTLVYYDLVKDPLEQQPLTPPSVALVTELQRWRLDMEKRRHPAADKLSPHELTESQRQALEALGYGEFFRQGTPTAVER